jgi:hypothetical protein
VWFLAIFGIPALVSFTIAFFAARNRWLIGAVIGLGVLLGIAFFLAGYFSAPPSSAPYNGCSDCENFLGRWWEPRFTGILDLIGFFGWLVGLGMALVLRFVHHDKGTPLTNR